jgi:hypothetical protein
MEVLVETGAMEVMEQAVLLEALVDSSKSQLQNKTWTYYFY